MEFKNLWDEIFEDICIEEDKIVNMPPDDLITHLKRTQKGLDYLKEIIEDLAEELEEKEMLIEEIHRLSNI